MAEITGRAWQGCSATTRLIAAGACAASAIAGYGAWQGWQRHKERTDAEVAFARVEAPYPTDYDADEPVVHPLRVIFDRAVAPLPGVGRTLETPVRGREPAARIEPAFAGDWSWTNEHVLEFRPLEPWPVGRPFEVRLGRTLVRESVVVRKRAFAFRAPAFEAVVRDAILQPDPTDPSVRRVVVSLAFSHPVDKTALESRILLQRATERTQRLVGGDGSLGFDILYDRRGLNAFVHSQPIPHDARPDMVRVEIAAGVRSARGGEGIAGPLQSSVFVPASDGRDGRPPALDPRRVRFVASPAHSSG